ncbi:hypothetical protein TcasGA2_TC003176 [Tribolium castaneum]|uniref:Uncharacterized protein n=1 Tax=Tribolium castaneum TaxID=7070 RepID=D6WEK3_TRICA|nr:PREDICTED: uncharacterized protein LOC662840 [Tribolium castaneum]EFA00337.1 hypothetical protein TcasGA2_TC003176 [Tribolium castaneum]|eukprot:XP_976435.1 PREDICTED: uncharacterized protein LOC662840 [Tribolium castaneum]
MARFTVFVLFLTALVATIAADCTGATKDIKPYKTEDIRYSLEVYYQLLLYIKENNLLQVRDCPMCKCFNDGTCVDLCDGGIWP